ncbi:MAG: cytochrome c3 family protein [Hyphomicrobiaceae bacterium]
MASIHTTWLIWLLATLGGAVILAGGMIYGGELRANLVIGKTTDGHYQIELACTACHTSPFAGAEAIQKACVGCHGKDLNQAKDSHPAKKFDDPRNADRLLKLEATRCVTCHTEHRPSVTGAMGVTLPMDYCALCHEGIGNERVSHKGLAFSTCTSAGCHNYHDNRALYEDFLEKHASEPDVLASPIVKLKAAPIQASTNTKPIIELSAIDAPSVKRGHTTIDGDWLASAHAKGGVNCSGCHAPKARPTPVGTSDDASGWIEKPDHTVCAKCHKNEVAGFTAGRHGMRLAAGLFSALDGPLGLSRRTPLTPMRPKLARIPMSRAAHGRSLTCTTCHAAHAFPIVKAEVEACLGCHSDKHSQAYAASPHAQLWRNEQAGGAPKGSGVSCATCHLPRETHEDPDTGEDRVSAAHNQNQNLRPNEKMLRSVCMSCHGLGFAMDALADPHLVERNFAGRPSARVESIDWVMRRLKEREGRSEEPTGGK